MLDHQVELGTSVLVVPAAQPGPANHLASVDVTSGGRLLADAGIGWSKREYDALGQSFETRGKRMDEILDLLRAAWTEDPDTFDGAGVEASFRRSTATSSTIRMS